MKKYYLRIQHFRRMKVQRILIIPFLAWIFLTGSKLYEICEFSSVIYNTLGILLMFIGMAGRYYSMLYIGGRKNGAGGSDSFLCDGVYSICRNPLYFFSFLGFLGILCFKGQIILIVAGGIIFLLIYHFTIQNEEEYLIIKYGEPYEKFLQEVPRFFPKLSLLKYEEREVFMPHYLHKEMKYAIIWFLSAFVIFLITYLQNIGVIKALINVW